jgi:hypothetical protein
LFRRRWIIEDLLFGWAGTAEDPVVEYIVMKI